MVEFLINAEMSTYLLIGGLLLTIAFVIYTLFEYQKELRINKLKGDDRIKRIKSPKDRRKLAFGDSEKIRLKLTQAGNPFSNFGLDEYSYHTYKVVIAALSALSAMKDGWMAMAGYFLMGYVILDVYIRMKKKRRHKQIKAVLGPLLTITIDGLQSGQTPMEVTTTALKKIPKDNALWVELKILNMKLLKGNLKTALDEFRERIDLEEIDNYCFSLLQYEIGGRAVTMLKMQLDLIHTLKSNRDKRDTQNKAQLSSVAVALLVVVLLMIILLPLMSSFKDMPMLQG